MTYCLIALLLAAAALTAAFICELEKDMEGY